MADEAKALSRSEIVLCCCLPIIVICTSTALIRSNQYLMQKDHFPYPFFLVILHCIFCSTFAALLLLMRPSLFPALTDPEKKVQLSMRYYVLSILPIALFFAFSLVLSNMAYKYCSVAFLQMIKEGNIICIYVMAVCAGIESYSHTKVAILVVMVAATWSCVEGELNFSFLGFMVQATGGLCEAAKTIFQSLVLSGKGQKLDPMSTVLVVMPMSGLCLTSVLLFNDLVMELGFASQPSYAELKAWKGYLALNICNAFVLNVLIAVFLKYLSPVSYILTGNIKDICVVCMSAFLIHEAISATQICGFTVQVLCVFAWTGYKQYASSVEDAQETEADSKRS